jgi:hypothetical protein
VFAESDSVTVQLGDVDWLLDAVCDRDDVTDCEEDWERLWLLLTDVEVVSDVDCETD